MNEPLKVSPKYTSDLADFARRTRVKGPWIAPIIFSKEWAEQVFPLYSQHIGPAFTWGGVIPSQLAALVGDDKTNRPIGIIAIRSDLQNSFNSDERAFVLAHEYAHILRNHWPLACLGSIGTDIAGKVIPTVENPTQRAALLNLLGILRTLLGIRFTQQSELDADATAARLVRSTETGLQTIRRLANEFADGDLSRPTHYVEIGGALVGVLTFRDRLNHLTLRP